MVEFMSVGNIKITHLESGTSSFLELKFGHCEISHDENENVVRVEHKAVRIARNKAKRIFLFKRTACWDLFLTTITLLTLLDSGIVNAKALCLPRAVIPLS